MKKRVWAMGAAVMMMGALTACAGGSDSKAASTQAEESGTEAGKGAVSESEGDDTETRQAERTDETSEGGPFTVGFDQDFPPMGFMGDNGEYTGFDLELAQAVCDMEGWELVKTPIEWASKDAELNNGNIDCIWNGFTINGKEDKYEWSDPYVNNQQVVVVAKDSGITKLADLKDKYVAAQSASAALQLLQKGGDQEKLGKTFKEIQEFPDYNTAFSELEAGTVDAVAMDVGVAKYQVNNRNNNYVILDENLNSEQYGIGFKKGNTELRDKVNADLKKLYDEGKVDELAKKYGIEDMICLGDK